MEEKALETFKKKLLSEKRRLENELKPFILEMKENQAGWSGEHGYENHLADLGSDTMARESDLSFDLNLRDMLLKVNDALARIEDGSFGICKACGKPISVERLRAIPWAELCIEDQKKIELAP